MCYGRRRASRGAISGTRSPSMQRNRTSTLCSRAIARWRTFAAAPIALVLGCALLAGCGSSGDSITLYNGQHVQTTDALVASFEKQSGIHVNVRSDDEDTLADQIVTEGSNSPADVIYTENSPALEYLQSKGLLAPVDVLHARALAAQVQLAAGRLGRRLGSCQRADLQPRSDQGKSAAQTRPRNWPTRSTTASSPSPPARPTSSRSSPPTRAPTGRRRR